jgi:ribosomal protein L40E
MKDSNHPKRIQALINYNKNPKYCKLCNNKIQVSENTSPSEARKKQFCNKSCANTFNNFGKHRRKLSNKSICECGYKKSKKAKVCRKCLLNQGLINKSLNDIINGKKYTSTLLNDVRKHARNILLKNKDKKCLLCSSREFDEILEACHIKGIMTFDLDTKISEINKIENLVWLCPSHHKMFDKGLINLDNW